MDARLKGDWERLPELLDAARQYAVEFLATLDARPPSADVPRALPVRPVPREGMGADATLQYFRAQHDGGLSGSAGARYLGFVTGGSTPGSRGG